MHRLFDSLPVSVVLDAACGTGRHSRILAARGHRVIGVDRSPEMLEKARRNVEAGEFREGDMTALPAVTAAVDAIVCALALVHVPDVAAAIREFARVVRPGGRVIISDVHPVLILLGWQAQFRTASGEVGFMRLHRHLPSDYCQGFATAGLRVTPLAAQFPVVLDRTGRVPVDEFMRVQGVERVFAAGDAARAMMDGVHASVMSCQHGRPMRRFAGHNVVCDLLGEPMLPLRIDWYVTVLDLGPWGAVYTEGWDRRVVSQGEGAKKTKRTINCVRIYPPRSRDRREIFEAAAPIVQAPPLQYR